MPNPGGFAGSRLKFLEDEFPAYTKAVTSNREGDFVLDLLRRFFKRYPMELADNIEPTEEMLASVNDEEPDEEPEPPNEETMAEEEYAEMLQKFNERRDEIEKKRQVGSRSTLVSTSHISFNASHDGTRLLISLPSI
jgi:hypothetical protein